MKYANKDTWNVDKEISRDLVSDERDICQNRDSLTAGDDFTLSLVRNMKIRETHVNDYMLSERKI